MGLSRGQSLGFEWFSGSRALGHKRRAKSISLRAPNLLSPLLPFPGPPFLHPYLPLSLLFSPLPPPDSLSALTLPLIRGGWGRLFICVVRG